MPIVAKIVGVLLLAGAATHVLRMIRPFAFIVGPYDIPPWVSLPFALAEASGGLLLLFMV